MPIEMQVTNGGSVDVGRDNKLFPAGKTTPHTSADTLGLEEIASHPDLSVTVTANPDGMRIPESVETDYDFNATPDAKELANAQGVNLAEVEGSGKSGRITKSDVESFIEGGRRPESLDFNTSLGTVTTEDPIEVQEEVQIAPQGIQKETPEGNLTDTDVQPHETGGVTTPEGH